jgi:putative ABC transport system ATP-binding protein
LNSEREKVVTASSLCKTYKVGDAEVKALEDVNLEVAEGELVAIQGPSGAGKTTLLYIIGGLDNPTSGKICVLGQNLARCDEEYLATFRCAYIGFVFQSFNLISTLTTVENIVFPMALAQWPKPHIRKRSRDLLDLTGLSHRAHHFPSQLSGGEQQRAAFARALANNAILVLADEPTGNLDSKTAKGIIALLEKLKNDGKTQIVATHDEGILHLADRIVWIEEGRVAQT